MNKQHGSVDAAGMSMIAIAAWVIAAWLTHVVVCVKTSAWGFLIAGAIFFPVALVHGTGYWFGAW